MVNMYTKELYDWIEAQSGKITLDIYSNNIYDDVGKYLENTRSKFINLYPGKSYDKLPKILCQYDVSIIFYKPY